MSKTAKKQARQGDVFMMSTEKPVVGDPVPREDGRIVLAHGEVTGHAHAIRSMAASLYALTGGLANPAHRLLRAERQVALRHEEHTEIILPAGSWDVRRQKEYSPAAIRNVAD